MKRSAIIIAGGIACLAVGAFFITSIPSNKNPLRLLTLDVSGSREQADPTVFKNSLTLSADRNAVLFVSGDIMLGRSVAELISQNGSDYPFVKIKEVVKAADCAMANLEGPITDRNGSPQNRMVFHFAPQQAAELMAAGFDGLSLANNHALDQGAKGQTDTKKYLAENNLGFFGDYGSDDGPVWYCATNGMRIAFLGLHDVYRKVDEARVKQAIEAVKKDADIVIPYIHWGEEYTHRANAHQVELAHALLDAGADMVIGGHPHVIQGIELYQGKPIFYSLGNFIFDQYFSTDTEQGLALRINYKGSVMDSVDLLPFSIPKSQPTFVADEEKNKMLGSLASWSEADLKEQILSGKLVFTGN